MISFLNNKYLESYIEVIKHLEEMVELESVIEDKVGNYCQCIGGFLLEMIKLEEELNEAYFLRHSFEELYKLNQSYYRDLGLTAYERSYTNPEFAVSIFGLSIGQILSSVHAEIRQAVGYAFEHRKASLFWLCELFIGIHSILDNQRSIIEDFYYGEGVSLTDDEMTISKILIEELKVRAVNYLEDKYRIDMFRRFDPNFKTYSQLILAENLEDDRYIFKYGMHIGYNEIELIKYFKQCSIEQLREMANTYTEAFIRGFERNNVDLTLKRTVNMAYHIGFERVMQLAAANFSKIGLVPLVYYDIKGTNRPRILNTKPNKQWEYDHRFDDELVLNEEDVEKMLHVSKSVMEENKVIIGEFAGPALIEVFGEKPFEPLSKKECLRYDDVTKEIKSKYLNHYQQQFSYFLPKSKYSFTINAYPLPEIGENFSAIFDETILVNTLDEQVYMDVQQKMIEVLDRGKFVNITGRNGNKTDLLVRLNALIDSETQSNFNNCTSDVNVPVGEVFTTPKLEGTVGKLHVKEVYLHNLKYIDLEIDFVDGMMDAFTCKNFDNEEDNVNFILENLTHPHKTLPLGEFAIGTNTKAYVMAKKYNIEKLLPILIGEKTGPHFAVGDTCYVWSEDIAVYNPDGREIVARDNSKSILRKSNLEEAYTYCHTDITIPYSELDLIRVKTYDGNWIDIVKGGRFVLEGTEILNEPLKEMEI